VATSVFGGLRVVDFSQGMAGPLATMVLADHGADVVKVEPPGGDWARTMPGHQMWNRGKKSVVLDLHRDADLEAARRLIDDADVALTASSRLSLDALGLTPEQRDRRHPRLIHCRITGFGLATGHEGLRPYEAVVAARAGRMNGNDALSGLASTTAQDRPIFVAAPINSYAAAMLAVQGITAALIARLVSGRGRTVDTSLLDGATAATMRLRFERGEGAAVRDPGVPRDLVHQGIVLCFLTAECADGRYIQMCARQDDHFRNWLTALGLAEMLGEERFAGAPLNFRSESDIRELEHCIRSRMRQRTRDEWMRLFIEDFDVGADPFLTPAEFLEHPQMVLNGRVVDVADPARGAIRQLGLLVALGATPGHIESPAPALGEHQGILDAVPVQVSPRRASAAESLAEPPVPLPLAGITILELAFFLAAPLGATLLAELGARVIKVEPPGGDPFRRVGLEFVHLVHGKESIAIDLKSADGRRIVHELVARSDAILHSFRPGVVERLGMDYESVRRINPTIVYAYGSAYGSEGPQAHRAAFHSTPNALNGGGIIQAGRGNAPVDDSYPDPCSGLAVGVALAMALLVRARHGIGQYVETTMLCSSGYVHSNNLVHYAGVPEPAIPDQQQMGPRALYRLYRCDDGWLFLGALQEHEVSSLGMALGGPSWFSDLAASSSGDPIADAELATRLEAVFAGDSALHWEALFKRHGVPAASAGDGTIEQFLVGEQLVHAGEHPGFGTYWQLPPRIRFSDCAMPHGTPTACGEHTQPILAELGYSAAAIAGLVAAGVVFPATGGTKPPPPGAPACDGEPSPRHRV
jgi:crotonobetainyl-CoA:carnitine CoA-transferase CaiB-like acyl-CoA transferase